MAGGASKSSSSSTDAAFVICVDTAGHDDLQIRRVYQLLPDRAAARSCFVRVIDDSGEDYLYPSSCFIRVELPKSVKTAIASAIV